MDVLVKFGLSLLAGAAAYVNYRWWWWIHPDRNDGPAVETFTDAYRKWVPTAIGGFLAVLLFVNGVVSLVA